MDREAWQATYSPWGHKRAGHDLATNNNRNHRKSNLESSYYYCFKWENFFFFLGKKWFY